MAAINFFNENVVTLTFTSITDTLQTWDRYEEITNEYDFGVDGNGIMTKNVLAPDPNLLELHLQSSSLAVMLEAKLRLLEENNIKVLKKQLVLLHSAICAFFACNQVSMSSSSLVNFANLSSTI